MTSAAASGSAWARAPGQSRYGGLASEWRQCILAGQWRPGQAIPAEAALSRSYGVALGTVRQALALLAADGLLERRHGKGTFVSGGLSDDSMLRFFRFRAPGAPTEPPASRIAARRVRRASAAEAEAFKLHGNRQVLELQRVRSIGGKPCLFERIVLPLPLFRALAQDDANDWGNLLYPVYQERCGVLVHKAEDHLTFAQLTATQARRLRLQAGDPCVVVRRVTRDRAGHCVELRTTHVDAFAFEYTAQVR